MILDLLYLILTQGYKFGLIKFEFLIERLDFIEEACLDLLNFSLQIPFIPVKKCMMLMGFYLNLVFEEDPNKEEKNNPNYDENVKFMTESGYSKMLRSPPRVSLRLRNKVEKFYEKHIKNVQDSPLAQIITVGTLRALLATCSSNVKNSGNAGQNQQNQGSSLIFFFCKIIQNQGLI